MADKPCHLRKYPQPKPKSGRGRGHARAAVLLVMEEIVTAKFAHHPDLAERLAATAGTLLVEGNDWHDQTWGSCRCDEHRAAPGAKALGVILMNVRLRLAQS